MIANLILDNVKAYNIKKFDIRLGETCKVELIDASSDIRWYSNNDEVLSIKVIDGNAIIKALTKGESEIQIQLESGAVVNKISVSVYDVVAASLNLTSGPSELK